MTFALSCICGAIESPVTKMAAVAELQPPPLVMLYCLDFKVSFVDVPHAFNRLDD